MPIDGWKMTRELWAFLVNWLNSIIPIMLPDGTMIGAWIALTIIGLFISILLGLFIKSRKNVI